MASQRGLLDVAFLLLNKGADPNAKDGNGRTPGRVAGSVNGNDLSIETIMDSKYLMDQWTAVNNRAEAIGIFIKRWPVLMTILVLQELRVFHLGSIDMAMMDLFESIGDEEDFV